MQVPLEQDSFGEQHWLKQAGWVDGQDSQTVPVQISFELQHLEPHLGAVGAQAGVQTLLTQSSFPLQQEFPQRFKQVQWPLTQLSPSLQHSDPQVVCVAAQFEQTPFVQTWLDLQHL